MPEPLSTSFTKYIYVEGEGIIKDRLRTLFLSPLIVTEEVDNAENYQPFEMTFVPFTDEGKESAVEGTLLERAKARRESRLQEDSDGGLGETALPSEDAVEEIEDPLQPSSLQPSASSPEPQAVREKLTDREKLQRPKRTAKINLKPALK